MSINVGRCRWSFSASALDLGSHSTLDSHSHTTEKDVSNSTELDLTALRATFATRQAAPDRRELGLAARQERIEGIDGRVGKVQRAVGYREEAVARHEGLGGGRKRWRRGRRRLSGGSERYERGKRRPRN